MSREFVDSMVLGNNVDAETAFKSSISTKVGDSLEMKRKEISSNFVKSVNPEETDADA